MDVRMAVVLAAVLVPVVAIEADAEVLSASTHGFSIMNTIQADAAPAEVYRAITAEVGRWWPSDHTYSGDAANLSLEARPGGCFCERLPEGGGVVHLMVLYAEPGKTLRLGGGLGPLQAMGVAGSLTFTLSPADEGTRVELTYVVSGYRAEGFEDLAPIVDVMQQDLVARLGRYLDSAGTERR